MTTYYVSAAGSNSNNGTTTGTSWADFTNVNTTAFQGGDSVLVNGGDTISSAINLGPANWGGTNEWNASHKSTNITLSGNTNNLLVATLTSGGGNDNTCFSTLGKSSGKWLFSCVLTTMGAHGVEVGIGNASASTTAGNYLGFDANSIGYVASNGVVFTNVNTTLGTVATAAQGNRIWFALDLTNQLLWIRVNAGNWNNSGTANPDTGTGGLSLSGLASATIYPGCDLWTASDAITADFNTPAGGKASTFAVWNASNPSSSSPVTFGSYGTGNGIISSGSLSGFVGYNISGVTVQSLTFTGGGSATTTVDGVLVWTDVAGNVSLPGVSLTGLTVSGYGKNGILVYGGSGFSGYVGTTISGCIVHDCTGGVTSVSTAGINFVSAGYGLGTTTPSFTGTLITGCTVYNCPGKAGATSTTPTGNGIKISESGSSVITLCEVYSCGTASNTTSGPVGIWTYDSNAVIISFCESYLNAAAANTDGGGFDIDGGCSNCTIEYCYSHDNYGPGFEIFSYNDGTVTTNTGSTIRYCISQNDGTDASHSDPGSILIGNSSVLTGVAIYNNTLYSSHSTNPCVGFAGSATASTTGHVANNIFQVASSAKFTNFYFAADPTGLIFSGNDYFGTFSLTWNATNYTTFASWVAAEVTQEPVAQRLASPTVSPGLTSAGSGGTTHGYHPSSLSAYTLTTSSALIGVGLNLNSLYSINPGSQDYYGNHLPGVTGTGYSVGADGQPSVSGMLLLGGSIGWGPVSLLGVAWKAAQAIHRNAVLSRRSLLTGRKSS